MTRTDQLVEPQSAIEDVIETDSLVEEVSIDGMCGVY
ncbi:mycofactocin precursor MftA [Agromyces sp. H66]|nr:mycofactocin precursor MftA [Agromyces sp. H66]